MSDVGCYMGKCGFSTGYLVLVIVRLLTSRKHKAQIGQTGIMYRHLVGHLLENVTLED